jgi:large subunit ribosomal protein L18
MTKGVTVENAKKLGEEISKKVLKAKIGTIVFDRGGYKYHGVVKALADSVRSAGIIF